MSPAQTALLMRNLDVALATFEVLENLLENNAGILDYHHLSTLAGEGRRKLDDVVNVLSDHL